MQHIEIAKDFSDVPRGVTPEDGEFSAERFREEWLVPALKDNDTVEVVLDGVYGYAASFLDEAFGGLVSKHDYSEEFLKQHLKITAKSGAYNVYKDIAHHYIHEAQAIKSQTAA